MISATNNIFPTLTIWEHFLSPISKHLALPDSAADLNSLFTVWWFIALNTTFLIIKNCSLASGSRNRLMQDLCRNAKWAERQMTCSAQLKAFFSLIIIWDLRKAGCNVGERPGEKCHPEETRRGDAGGAIKCGAQPHHSSDLGQQITVPQPEGVGQNHFLGQPYQTLSEEKHPVWAFVRLWMSVSFPQSSNGILTFR